MLVTKLRKHMNWMIWLIIIGFTISVFLIGAASFLDNWIAQDQRKERRETYSSRTNIDPEFNVQSTKPLAAVLLDGAQSIVTEGDLNRMLFTNRMVERLKQLPAQYRSIFTAQLLDQLISEELMFLEGQKAQYNVDSKVLSEVEKMRLRSGGDQRFLADLKSSGWKDVEELKTHMSRNFILQEVREKLFEGVAIPDEEVEFYYSMHKKEFLDEKGNTKSMESVKDEIKKRLREKVSDKKLKTYYEQHKSRWQLPRKLDFQYILISQKSPKNKKEIEDAIKEDDLKSYYKANQTDFLSADLADVGHIYLSRNELKKEVVPTDEQIQDYYDKNQTDYMVEEMVSASHILIKADKDDEKGKAAALKKLNEIRADILAKKISFEDAAKKHSEDPGSAEKGGDLGLFPRGTMVKEFEDYSFSGKIGELGEPIATQYGYHMIRVDAKQEEQTKTLEEVRTDVIDNVKDEQVDKLAETKIAAIEAELKTDPGKFAELVQKFSNSDSKKDGGVLRRIYLGEGNKPAQIKELSSGGEGLDYPILINIKKLIPGEVTEMVETSNGWHFMKLIAKYDPEIRPYEAVKADVRKKILDQKLDNNYKNRVASVKSGLAATNSSFDGLTEEFSDSLNSGDKAKVVGLELSDNPNLDDFGPIVRLDLSSSNRLHNKVASTLKYMKSGEKSAPVELENRTLFFLCNKVHATDYLPYVKVKEEVVQAVTLSVSDMEVKNEYDANKEKYFQPGKITVQHIAYQKGEVASEQLQAIQGKLLSFDSAGLSYLNMDQANFKKNKGEISLKDSIFDEKAQDIIKALKPGEISTVPVKSMIGYHIVKMVSKSEDGYLSLAEASVGIRNELSQKKRTEVLQGYVNELRNRAEKITIF